jgi:UDP-GlcNAc:undecaprenyl-phosphate GlcNAc-1-phosphate transferase
MTLGSIFHHLVFAGILFVAAVLVTRYMLKRQILALPNHRSSHETPTPSSGGVSIVLITLSGYLAYYFIGGSTTNWPPVMGVVIGSLVVAIVGFLDDLDRLPSFKTKLLSQIVAVAILFACGLVVDRISLPWIGSVELGLWGYLVTLIWVVGLTNAFNFMDGLDGMAGSTAIVAAAFFAFIAFSLGSISIFVVSYIVAASVFGFLLYNFPKARIFMGDVGSQFLGFLFAALAVLALKTGESPITIWVMPLLFFHFIFDTAYTFARRLRTGEVVTDAHRSHLYQLVNRLGWSHPKVSLLYAGMCASQGIAAIWFVSMSGIGQSLMFLALFLLHAVYLLIVIRAARARDLL